MQECLEFLHQNNYYIIFDIEDLKITACFRFIVSAISYLERDGVSEIHRLMEPSNHPFLSFENSKLEDFQKITVPEVIELLKSNEH